MYPKDDPLDLVSDTTNFRIEYRRVRGDGSWYDASWTPPVIEQLTKTDIGQSHVAFEYLLRGVERQPYSLRVAAENLAGIGPFSAWTPPVPETCQGGGGFDDEFLQTHLPLENWTCAACPEGAYCGGLPYENITNLDGYWRVDWSAYQLLFQKCRRPESCLGVTVDRLVATTAEAAGNRSQAAQAQSSARALLALSPTSPRGITGGQDSPARRLSAAQVSTIMSGSVHIAVVETGDGAGGVPMGNASGAGELVDDALAVMLRDVRAATEEEEQSLVALVEQQRSAGCQPGYEGNMCTTCQPGYARKGTHGCVKCYSHATVWTVIFLVMIGLVVVVGFLIVSAISSGGRESRIEPMVMKILFTHMQQIAIAASFNLEWPGVVRALFDLLDSLSSVSENVLSLDCVIPPQVRAGDSIFYSKTILVLMMPFIIIATVALFWIILAQLPESVLSRLGTAECCNRASAARIGRKATAAERHGATVLASLSIHGTGGSRPAGGLSRRQRTATHREEFASAAADARLGALDGAIDDVDDGDQCAIEEDELDASGGASAGAAPSPSLTKANPLRALQQRGPPLPPPRPPPRARPGGGPGTAGNVSDRSLNPMRRAGVGTGGPMARDMVQKRPAGKRKLAIKDSMYRQVPCFMRVFPRTSLIRRRYRWLRDRIMISIIVTAFLIHATLTTSALRVFTCNTVGIGPAERTYLEFDLSVRCDTPTAIRFMLGLALPAFVLYALGIPGLAFWVLYSRRHKLGTKRVRMTYGFLYAGFKAKYFGWESLIMLRKVALAVVAVFLAPAGVAFQTYTAIVVLGIAAVIHSRSWPYNRPLLNQLELASLITAFGTMVCGLYLSDPLASTSVRLAATCTIFLLNIVLLATVAVKLLGGVAVKLRDRSQKSQLQRRSSTKPAVLSEAQKRQLLLEIVAKDAKEAQTKAAARRQRRQSIAAVLRGSRFRRKSLRSAAAAGSAATDLADRHGRRSPESQGQSAAAAAADGQRRRRRRRRERPKYPELEDGDSHLNEDPLPAFPITMEPSAVLARLARNGPSDESDFTSASQSRPPADCDQ